MKTFSLDHCLPSQIQSFTEYHMRIIDNNMLLNTKHPAYFELEVTSNNTSIVSQIQGRSLLKIISISFRIHCLWLVIYTLQIN